MKLIAKKPCSFEGHKFFIGDEIPTEFVANPKALEKMGVIAIAGNADPIPFTDPQEYVTPELMEIKFEILIHAEEGDLPLQVTNEELNVFTDILQIPVSKAEDKQKISEMIQNIVSEDLLIMLDALDGRKFVKEEAQARAQAISESAETGGDDAEDSEPEQTGGDE